MNTARDCPLSKGSLAYNRGHQTKIKNQTPALAIQKQSLTKREPKGAGDPAQKKTKDEKVREKNKS